MKNTTLLIAAAICLITAMIHLIGGQLTLVDPMLESNMSGQARTEWLGGWHMITLLLFATAYVLAKNGWNYKKENKALYTFLGWLYIGFGPVFIIASIWNSIFAPQWVLLMPIGILILIGARK